MRRLAISLAAAVAAILAAATTGGTGAAAAGPPVVPGGPWVKDSQHISLKRLHDYAELTDALRKLERRGISVRNIGRTNEDRDIWYAETGSGPVRLLYITQQHGNEPLGTEAALHALQRLGGTDSAWAREMREKITLGVVVRANPDGSERFWRQNYDPDCSGAFCRPGRGLDINRFHDPALNPDDNPSPESGAIQRLFRQLRPEIVVDYHHQGTYVGDDGRMITTSILWPTNSTVDPAVVRASKRVNVLTYDTLQRYGFANVTLYPGSGIAGIARNSFGMQGSASMLFELRGGIGQKSGGYLIRTAYASMMALVEAAATGMLDDVDPARADEIPPRGDPVQGDEE